jgi:hypothetical protein
VIPRAGSSRSRTPARVPRAATRRHSTCRTRLLWAAAGALLWPGTPVAAASLKAVGAAAAGAHRDSDEGQLVLTPGPDSQTITAGAAASDAVINDAPPPDAWEMQSLVTGVATARYGSLAGRAHAEASVPTATSFLAGGQVSLNVGFTDGAVVLSDTLHPETPVTLGFLMTLEGTAVHFADTPGPNLEGVGAAVRHEVKVRDLDAPAQPTAQGALVINSAGIQEPSATFEFDTAVGHRIEIVADLFVAAGADIDYLTYGYSQGSADVVADQTAELFFQPAGDVRLVSDSGHDYAVPEPSRGTLMLVSAAMLLLVPRSSARVQGRLHGYLLTWARGEDLLGPR